MRGSTAVWQSMAVENRLASCAPRVLREQRRLPSSTDKSDCCLTIGPKNSYWYSYELEPIKQSQYATRHVAQTLATHRAHR